MQEQPDEDEDQQQRIVDYLSERRQWSFENAQTLPAKLDRKVINGNPANHFGNVTWIVQAATRTNEGFRTYVALERLGKGSQAQLHTVNDVCAQDPNLSKKNVRDGMRELARLGFIDLRHESPRSAMRACVIFNPARADVDPRFYRLDFTAGPLPKMANPRKREPRRTAPLKAEDANGKKVIVPREPQPMCPRATKSGQPCKLHVMNGGPLCWRHTKLDRTEGVPPTYESYGGSPCTPQGSDPTYELSTVERTNRTQQVADPTYESYGGGLTTQTGREGGTSVPTERPFGLSTSCSTESLVPAGVGRVADRGTGELLEDEGVINLHEAEFTDDRPPLGKALGYQRYDYISPSYRRPKCAACGLPTIGEPDDDICTGTKCRIARKQRGGQAA